MGDTVALHFFEPRYKLMIQRSAADKTFVFCARAPMSAAARGSYNLPLTRSLRATAASRSSSTAPRSAAAARRMCGATRRRPSRCTTSSSSQAPVVFLDHEPRGAARIPRPAVGRRRGRGGREECGGRRGGARGARRRRSAAATVASAHALSVPASRCQARAAPRAGRAALQARLWPLRTPRARPNGCRRAARADRHRTPHLERDQDPQRAQGLDAESASLLIRGLPSLYHALLRPQRSERACVMAQHACVKYVPRRAGPLRNIEWVQGHFAHVSSSVECCVGWL